MLFKLLLGRMISIMASYRRKNAVLTVAVFLLLFIILLPLEVKVHLDENLRLFEGQEHSYQFKFPVDLYVRADREDILHINGSPMNVDQFNRIDYHGDFSLKGLTKGSVNLEFSLFNGLIPIRQLTVDILPEMSFMAGGHSIGIKIHDQGVIVVGYHYLEKEGEHFSPAQEAGIQIGDIIMKVNGKAIKDIDSAASLIIRESTKGEINFTVKRSGHTENITVEPFLCPDVQEFRIGLYIRDTAAGVGTLTFYDPESNSYGALGHIITDLETNTAVEIAEGLIVRADIINIKMAQRGRPGEKAGIFREEKDILGSIEKNTPFGIFGRLERIGDYMTPYPDPIPLGLAFEVQTGPAEILTVVEGNNIQSFDIYIERTTNQNRPGDKGIIIRVKDENLLDITGGIVQGMSGSPIIQNGRLVGAVTHVFVNDPTRGYATYVEWMVKEAEILPLS